MSGRRAVVVVGSSNLDLVVEVPRIPQPGETVLGTPITYRSGGKGANQAIAALKAGAEVTFFTALGDDDFARRLRESHVQAGLDTAYELVLPNTSSGSAMIVVDAAAENTITVSPGANSALLPQTVEASVRAALADAGVVIMQLEIPLETVEFVAGLARELGVAVQVNASPLGLADESNLPRIVALTDVLVVNETEARSINPGAEDVEQTVRGLLRHGPRIVVATLGSAGALIGQNGSVTKIPAFPVDAVDTTGAGDAFSGALACELAGGASIEQAVRFASAAGALATTAFGAQGATPTREVIERFLSRQ